MKLVKTRLTTQLSKASLENSIVKANECGNNEYHDEVYEEFGNKLTF